MFSLNYKSLLEEQKAGEMAQWVKHLQCKHGELRSDLQDPREAEYTRNRGVPAGRWEMETGDYPRVCWQASLLYTGNSLKQVRNKDEDPTLSSDLWMYTHMYLHTCAYAHAHR